MGEVAANADGEGKESLALTTSQSACASSSPKRRAFNLRKLLYWCLLGKFFDKLKLPALVGSVLGI